MKCSYIDCEENATCTAIVMRRQIPSCTYHKDKFYISEGRSWVMKSGLDKLIQNKPNFQKTNSRICPHLNCYKDVSKRM